MATILDPIKMKFYTEKFDKENQNIKLVEEFVPSVETKLITGKFYSKYETPELFGSISPQFMQIIDRHERMVPNEIYSYKPPTTNMLYGWFAEPLIPRSTDPRLYFPLNHSQIVKTEMRIRDIDKGILRAGFRGIPFKTI
ncbi:hypothetical protein PV325_011957 [Microctonus aethiopoides]|uniref:Uncharacterized protein n=1 Tax=Microctonus aethiopoides TaxID=144406 RepID=A0AA39FVU7_9HYME|nr:hypothetical protein PV325_011957 [Microctonus aethiopoides]KAK0072578.1 hypothetical protein PV326_014323 [Microctonus aethiopoides]KAK0176805.1 hypothetical protein PV328_000910 [Microctonus aethiopoides]